MPWVYTGFLSSPINRLPRETQPGLLDLFLGSSEMSGEKSLPETKVFESKTQLLWKYVSLSFQAL